jgi:LPXTG-motif cell wall-anchored protein
VNQTPFPSSRRRLRRLAVVATGALLGLGGVFAIAAPASAHIARLSGYGECADTGWTAKLTLTNTWDQNAADVEWVKVYDANWNELPDLHVTGIQNGTHLTKSDNKEGGDDEVTGTVAVPANLTKIKVKIKVVYDDDHVQKPHTQVEAPTDCAPTTPPTTPPATESPSPSPSASASTPAESPSAPASETPSPVPGAGGGGPQLPTTGASIGTAVGIAVVLLAAGAGLFFFFRRRRIRFTA